MNGLIKFSLNNWYAVVVSVLAIGVVGVMTISQIPRDILPTNRSPAVQVLTFYGGMPAAAVEKDISNRMERRTQFEEAARRVASRRLDVQPRRRTLPAGSVALLPSSEGP